MPPREIRKPSGQLTTILADNLREFRQTCNYSQEKLAELCGLHRTYIGSVERCERNVKRADQGAQQFVHAFLLT